MSRVPEQSRRAPSSRRRREQLAAGKVPTPAWNVRAIVGYILGALVILGAVVFFLNRDTILSLADASGEPKTETCTVQKVNYTREFTTDCGRFYWGADVGVTPYGLISIGHKYEFTSEGPRFPLLGLKPRVTAYVEVP